MSHRSNQQTSLEELKARIDALSPVAVPFVARLVDSLLSPPHVEVSDTWITKNPDWVEYFGLTISAHHSNTLVPLGLVNFEVAFRKACGVVGWKVDDPGSATRRFFDATVQIDGQSKLKLSLKSTAAKRLAARTAHISKLTEAAWIQDVRSARDRKRHTLELFRKYRKAVDSIIMLRAFRGEQNAPPTKYQLLEIPTAIFASLEDAPQSAFAADGPTIDCSYQDEPVAARVSLDRSDAKITVKQIKLSVCTVHAEWHNQRTAAPPL